jgi:hypothetical protein
MKKKPLVKKERATCISCGRKFTCSQVYCDMVRAGRLESLCAHCDGDHEPKGD